MPRVHLSAQSRADMDEIAETIGQHSLVAAERIIDRLIGRMKLLRDHPLIGHPRNDLRPGLRSLRCGKYVILHRSHSDGVGISRIVHHSRNLIALEGLESFP